jgi:uncharacterized protein YbjT (DUF2867 family)
MRVLVAGADGFIGRHVVTALRASGHEVMVGVRGPGISGRASMACDFSRDLDPAIWARRLAGFDAVVNAVGILRESGSNSFERIHVQGPTALFNGCALAGVRRIIQISALGAARVDEYLHSKHRGDAALAALDLDWTILRPSLVYSAAGSYGGTSLLRALAALPAVIFVPGTGEQQIQPIRAEDLSLAIVGLIENGGGRRQIIPAIGPERLTLLEYLKTVRRWLELSTAVVVRTPLPLVHGLAWLGQYLSDGPWGLAMWRMLQDGNVGPPESKRSLAMISGVSPMSLSQTLSRTPSFVQDRWHARLYFLGPLLRLMLAMLWISSGIVGFTTPVAQDRALFATTGISSALVMPLVRAASLVDFVLGILALIDWRSELVAALMCVSLVIYSVFVGTTFPSAWLEPFGGLLKNLPLIPATLVMAVLSRRR